MRLWSVHPRYLDRQALVACWREALLAQAVIGRSSGGYTRHPQLERFRRSPDPSAAIGAFLAGILAEAEVRGYRFDHSKILRTDAVEPLPLTTGQLDLEWRHLLAKLADRSPGWLALLQPDARPEPHPIFRLVEGPVASWERAS